MEMIDELTAAERRIQSARQRKNNLLEEIRRLAREQETGAIRLLQAQVGACSLEEKAAKHFWHAVKLVGDTIASRLVEPDLMKAFEQKQPSGFIGGKSGLNAERDAFDSFVRKGYMVLINDLTHCMKGGDLTLKKDGKVSLFEVKSKPGAYTQRDTIGQIVANVATQQYIERDVMPVRVGGDVVHAVRLDGDVKEDWHWGVPGQLARALRPDEVRVVQVGRKTYVSARRTALEPLRRFLDDKTSNGDWIVASLADRVDGHGSVPPFTNWFNPQHSTAIVARDLIVLSCIALSDVEQLMESVGVRWQWKTRDSAFPAVSYEPIGDTPFTMQPFRGIFPAEWHWRRVLYSFLALESYVAIVRFLLSPAAAIQSTAKTEEFQQRRGSNSSPAMRLHPRYNQKRKAP